MDATIGTAGWSIAAESAGAFPPEGTSLERYASVFRGVEINSSFHRPHRASTWARWAQSVPDGFRFAVKLPKTISHERRLAGCDDLVERFLEESAGLGGKLGLLLLQLPPKLGFDPELAGDFLAGLAARTPARIACEPRHPGWFEPAADALLAGLRVARVAADPALVPAAGEPGGWRGLSYWRLHGSPVMYRSAYGAGRLEPYAAAIATALAEGREVWCMFDNTASSAATADALALRARLERVGPPDR
ncbi:MAG TPA: DUF72 domain-containing protein [Allosphingosinicella sp.]|nr:DUF72 domain-containing protein [Allosphingosinicella sp.]